MRRFLRPFLGLLTLAPLVPLLWFASGVGAQNEPVIPTVPSIPADQCLIPLNALWTQATEACVNAPSGYICNAGSSPQAEPTGPIANALAPVGALVEAANVDALRTPRLAPEIGGGGLVWIRPAPPLTYTALLIGDVTIRDVSPADFPPWTSIVVQTSEAPPACQAAPLPALVLQTPIGLPTRVVVNGASLSLNGTVLIHTDTPTFTTTFVALSGVSSVLTLGTQQPLLTGQQLVVQQNTSDFGVTASPPSAAVPFDTTMLQNLPVALFDRPLVLPQPGNVSTQGDTNLRSSPGTGAGVITLVPGGEILSVLGQNPEGTWYHVRRDNGETGWMLAELLARNVGTIAAVYVSTPLPPQRYGDSATLARVAAPAGVNLRVGPDSSFPSLLNLPDGAVVSLLARSPYGPWVKVAAGETQGWVALIALDTQAYIDALPIDPQAPPPPPPPQPTRIPGSFGNAFPNPDGPGN
ncbi:hypothetical protein FBR02_20125 [Anaerolineae bacterium CFX9]|nr:hypothetical protein [Anaerolineae bacterium CFX9]